ncbi:MAG: ATP synthase F1 subunit epsilon [Myxococcota bacterium]
MADLLTLVVTTPKGLVLETEADAVEANSVNGELGVLPGHLPLLAALRCGLVQWRSGSESRVACMGPGFVEVEPDRVNVLTDLFAMPGEIDVDATKEELKEANDALKAFPERYEGPEYEELQRDIDWAQAKLDCVAAADK